MKAFAYVRVSTTGQAEEGVSLEAQRSRIAAWCAANGAELAGVFTDAGISGKKMTNRPGLQAALTAVCKARGVIVVYSLSRLARSTKDAIEISARIEKAKANLVSLSEQLDTQTASGKLYFRMMAAFNEFERDIISERTRGAMAHKRSKGELVGQVPFGFRLSADGVTLEQDQLEQATLADLRALRSLGLTWAEISDELNRRGLRTKRGQEWSHQTARKIGLRVAA